MIRTAQLYGFKGDFISFVLHSLTKKQEFYAFENLTNCPTWIKDLFLMISIIIKGNHKGIFHCVRIDSVPRYEFALEIAHSLNLDKSLIKPYTLNQSDIRTLSVRLNGTCTFQVLKVFPNNLSSNISHLSI